MNQLAQVAVAQNRLIAQIDAATAELEKIGHDPLNDAVARFEAAANRVKERFSDAQVRVMKLAQALIGDLVEMADGIAIDFSVTIEPQPIEALPPSPVVEVPVQADQEEVKEEAKEEAKDEQEQPEPQPISADDIHSRLTEEQQNLVEALIAGPPPANGRGGHGKGNKRKR